MRLTGHVVIQLLQLAILHTDRFLPPKLHYVLNEPQWIPPSLLQIAMSAPKVDLTTHECVVYIHLLLFVVVVLL